MNAIYESDNEMSPQLRVMSNPESPMISSDQDDILELNKSDGETVMKKINRKFSRKQSMFKTTNNLEPKKYDSE
jgi:hypothetical protein